MISVADLKDKSCSQPDTTLFTIAHRGSEGRNKLQCGGNERTLYGKRGKEFGGLLG